MRHSWKCEGHRHCDYDLSEPTHKGSRIVKYHKSCMNVVNGQFSDYRHQTIERCWQHGNRRIAVARPSEERIEGE